ncbi:glycosyltransferase family 2 protein [Gordonibacter massiliensis (ex Traore et al. 2017)]|uniref:glycosyltransferase family 2 protein n=1 Tax=Gordonibacter massiliensis (ex Traore et al. 2017) TaxID=1841863 RepID=UPI001C8BDC4E|nr:glycosyltransferase family 2 protein [Gordonibacter massiliensis (ex Traore et al. 2017)]MBX9033655.1 glycosyltransferase family 2 protein [Gordonibacter massiliensis (ex Traore et al. 2017)]
MKALCIIPAHNEEESLEKTVDDLRTVNPDVDFLVVNDGSTDATGEICRRNSYPFLDLPINLGLSGAFQAGMRYAYRYGYDCAVQFDADGQHCAEYVAALVEEAKAGDIVIGSRFVTEKRPVSLRMLGSVMIEKAIRITTGSVIKDPTSGMRAFNKRMIVLFAKELNFGPEPDTVSYLIKHAHAKVSEVPVKMRERSAGESYFNFKSSMLYMLRMTTSILLIQLFRKDLKGDLA